MEEETGCYIKDLSTSTTTLMYMSYIHGMCLCSYAAVYMLSTVYVYGNLL